MSLRASATNHRRYKTGTVEIKQYPDRSHFTVGEPGWENVLDHAIDWVEAKTA